MKLANMNLHKDVLVWLVATFVASIAVLAHQPPTALAMQVEWAAELGRLVHALTEPTTVAAIVATLGAVGRYEIWKRRLGRKHEQEIADLQRTVRELEERLNDTDKS